MARKLSMMLTTARAIVAAAVLLTLGLLAHAAIPRYEIRFVDNDPKIAFRIDRWRGIVEMGPAQGPMRPNWYRWAQASNAAQP